MSEFDLARRLRMRRGDPSGHVHFAVSLITTSESLVAVYLLSRVTEHVGTLELVSNIPEVFNISRTWYVPASDEEIYALAKVPYAEVPEEWWRLLGEGRLLHLSNRYG